MDLHRAGLNIERTGPAGRSQLAAEVMVAVRDGIRLATDVYLPGWGQAGAMIDAGKHSGETGAAADLDHVIEQYHRAAGEFVRGDPRPIQLLFTRRDDVSLLDPTGGVQTGWEAVSHRQQRNAVVRDAEPGTFERVATCITPELASIVEIERFRAKVAGSQESVPVTLRTTTIFRPEDGTWKVIHRHADPHQLCSNTGNPQPSQLRPGTGRARCVQAR